MPDLMERLRFMADHPAFLAEVTQALASAGITVGQGQHPGALFLYHLQANRPAEYAGMVSRMVEAHEQHFGAPPAPAASGPSLEETAAQTKAIRENFLERQKARTDVGDVDWDRAADEFLPNSVIASFYTQERQQRAAEFLNRNVPREILQAWAKNGTYASPMDAMIEVARASYDTNTLNSERKIDDPKHTQDEIDEVWGKAERADGTLIGTKEEAAKFLSDLRTIDIHDGLLLKQTAKDYTNFRAPTEAEKKAQEEQVEGSWKTHLERSYDRAEAQANAKSANSTSSTTTTDAAPADAPARAPRTDEEDGLSGLRAAVSRSWDQVAGSTPAAEQVTDRGVSNGP